MNEICGDNRFEIIAKAKADLLEGTNIETDEAEMAVLDNILFRCWQMGWLDRYARKTENSSEIPNNCEECKHWSDTEDGCADRHGCKTTEDSSTVEPQTETQTETQNSNLTFEKRTMRDCYNCKKYEAEGECIECKFEPKTEPQTERSSE